MRTVAKRLIMIGLVVTWIQSASAQTADEIVEKYLTATGGRTALGKLKSRSTSGTVTLSTPVGDVSGAIETLNEAPNKSRSLMKLDLSSLGVGQVVIDQRFDGQSGYVLDTLQGNRDLTGDQLQNMKNQAFPNPFLNYRDMGATVELLGKEKIGERDAYSLVFKPKSGPVVRVYLDAETYLPIKLVIKIFVPQLGNELEQTTEFFDYRAIDGVKVPFQVKSTSSVQTFVIKVEKVEHNKPIDETLFSRP
jgi:hypothetical protein